MRENQSRGIFPFTEQRTQAANEPPRLPSSFGFYKLLSKMSLGKNRIRNTSSRHTKTPLGDALTIRRRCLRFTRKAVARDQIGHFAHRAFTGSATLHGMFFCPDRERIRAVAIHRIQMKSFESRQSHRPNGLDDDALTNAKFSSFWLRLASRPRVSLRDLSVINGEMLTPLMVSFALIAKARRT